MKAVLRDSHTTVSLISLVFLFLFCAATAVAQTTSPTPVPSRSADGSKSSPDVPLTTFEEELRAKHAIKLAEKDHQENVNRAREIGELGKQIQEGLKNKTNLDRDLLKKIAEIGPIPRISARQYLLRINDASGPPGSVTSVHSHLGSEAFFVLTGEQSIRGVGGLKRVEAGQGEPGQTAGAAMQVSSSGSTELHALVMFVVDANKPFSSPASMH